jgi:hypothetical protein
MAKSRKTSGKMTNDQVWSTAVERASRDKTFRSQLLKDTHGVLTRMGGKPEKGVSYSVLVETPEHRYLVLPHASTTTPVSQAGDETKSGGF